MITEDVVTRNEDLEECELGTLLHTQSPSRSTAIETAIKGSERALRLSLR